MWKTQFITNRQCIKYKDILTDKNHIAYYSSLEDKKEIYGKPFRNTIKDETLLHQESISNWTSSLYSKNNTPYTVVTHTNDEGKIVWEPVNEYFIRKHYFTIGNVLLAREAYIDGSMSNQNKKEKNYTLSFKYEY